MTVDSGEVIRELERRYLPALRAAETEINATFPGVRAGVWSEPHGQATNSTRHVIALSCLLSAAAVDQPDEVSLELCVGGFARPIPLIEVTVVWGYPGQMEADLFSGSTALTEEALARLDAELARLLTVLRAAVCRGRPLA
jgi:hypothetical protein